MPTWQPSDRDLLRVFDEQNPWHHTGLVPEALARSSERPLAASLWQTLERQQPRRFQLVLGPRRVGKSTVMYQIVRHLLRAGVDRERLWWLRLDHPLLMQEPLGDLVRRIVDENPGPADLYLFLDELVYAKDWDLWLKTFYDDQWPVRIVASSSATAALADRRHESGVGRWANQYLLPYQFTEFLDLVGAGVKLAPQPDLEEALLAVGHLRLDHVALAEQRTKLMLVGGFPELLTQAKLTEADDPTRLLESQQTLKADAVERAIYKDIPQSFGIADTMLLERLLYVLAGQVGGLLSPKNICGELDGMSTPTFTRYLSYLEQAFLVFTLPNYSGREMSVQKRGKKLYFADGAIRNAALQRGIAPLTNAPELGLLTENLVATNLSSLARQSDVRLLHWRDARDEVDIIYDHPTAPLAFEIGLSPSHSLSGLRALAARYPRFGGRCWLVAPGVAFRSPIASDSGVGTISLDAFLLAVGRQTEAALALRLGAAPVSAQPAEPTLFDQ